MPVSREAKEKKNAYMHEWRRKNKKKVKEYNEKYWENKINRANASKECRCPNCNKLLGEALNRETTFRTNCVRCKKLYICTYDHVEVQEAL